MENGNEFMLVLAELQALREDVGRLDTVLRDFVKVVTEFIEDVTVAEDEDIGDYPAIEDSS